MKRKCPICHGELRVTQIESKRAVIVHLHCKCGFNKRVRFPPAKPITLTIRRLKMWGKAIGKINE
jgi:C4-type Zn-finger protein